MGGRDPNTWAITSCPSGCILEKKKKLDSEAELRLEPRDPDMSCGYGRRHHNCYTKQKPFNEHFCVESLDFRVRVLKLTKSAMLWTDSESLFPFCPEHTARLHFLASLAVTCSYRLNLRKPSEHVSILILLGNKILLFNFLFSCTNWILVTRF